ncbi:CBR-ATG-2 protein [Loa loa]|nr:CBR-ATG-2 protein [Loa loa]EJD76479.1 CBR-ATG-2 protein [Loa loa]
MGDTILPGPQGKMPRTYEVDKERHTESYVTAVRGNDHKDAKTISVDESKDGIQMRACAPLLEDESVASKLGKKFRYTIAEMERYRNDPFWKTLRWLLFILFWLLWISMFVIAVLIVILSPGCALRAASNWWENAIIYQIWTPSFQDSDASGVGDFIGLTNRLENLRRLGVQVVWLNPFLHSDDFNDAVRDHLAVDPKLGINDDAYKLIDAVHDKGMKIVVSLPVSVTSKDHDWYRQSSQASLEQYANFSGYYHWRKTVEHGFFMSKHKNAFYMHFENRSNWPILNWQNTFVQENMFKIMSFWIDKGIDGFYLSGIEYLARMKSGSMADWPRIVDILRDIRNHVDTYVEKGSVSKTKQIVLFAARDNARENDKKELVLSGLNLVVDYELGSIGKDNKICNFAEGNVAECIHEIVTELVQFHATNNISAVWEFGNPHLSRIASRVKSQQQAELLTMLQLLLPGTSSIYYGDEIGMMDLPTEKLVPVQRGAMQWDDSANAGFSNAISASIMVHPDFADNNWARQYSSQHSQLKTFQKIARLRRRDEALNSGRTIIGQLMNSSFTITRYVKAEKTPIGNTYLGAFNFGKADTALPIQESNVMENKEIHQVMVFAFSSNAEQYYYHQVIDLSSGTVTIPPEQGVIFKFSS